MAIKPMTTFIPTVAFTEDRCPPGSPIAIVLHEFDGAIETLDAIHRNCSPKTEPGCHVSFHYGIQNCIIHQYVLDKDTSWTFPEDPADEDCGVDDWAVAMANPGIDPDCYTINIAVATGVATAGSNACHNPENIYTPQLYRCLGNLICYLLEEYGIANDTDHVWRHLEELCDMNYTTLSESIQDCIDNPPPEETCLICDQIPPDLTDDPLVCEAECSNVALAIKDGSPVLVKVRDCLPYREETADTTLVPETDGIVAIDASTGTMTVTLAPPAECDSNHFHIKRLDNTPGNLVTVTAPELIDGCQAIQLPSPGPFCASGGASVHVAWTGATWVIL